MRVQKQEGFRQLVIDAFAIPPPLLHVLGILLTLWNDGKRGVIVHLVLLEFPQHAIHIPANGRRAEENRGKGICAAETTQHEILRIPVKRHLDHNSLPLARLSVRRTRLPLLLLQVRHTQNRVQHLATFCWVARMERQEQGVAFCHGVQKRRRFLEFPFQGTHISLHQLLQNELMRRFRKS